MDYSTKYVMYFIPTKSINVTIRKVAVSIKKFTGAYNHIMCSDCV